MAGQIPRSLGLCLFLQTTEPLTLSPSGAEGPKPDTMGAKLLAEDGGQEAMWLGELWACVCLMAFHFLFSLSFTQADIHSRHIH